MSSSSFQLRPPNPPEPAKPQDPSQSQRVTLPLTPPVRRNDLLPIPAAASATQVDVGDYVYLADDDVYEIVGIDDSVSGEIRITGRELFPGDIISPSATSMIDDGPENSHRETVARVFSGEQRYEFWLPRAKNVRRMNCDVLSICSDGIVHLKDAEGYALDVPVPKGILGAKIRSGHRQTGQMSESFVVLGVLGNQRTASDLRVRRGWGNEKVF